MATGKYQNQKGVTLVELSVVVTIIGILLAGVLSGVNLLKSSKLRKVITEITSHERVVRQFQEEYKYLPGDYPRAEEFWSACNCNGDGNGFIGWSNTSDGTPHEDLFAWEHMTLSDLLPGSYDGVNANGSTRYIARDNVPGSEAFSDIVYTMLQITTPWYNTSGTVLHVGAADSDGLPWNGMLNARDARSVDEKMDDGQAAYGLLYVTRSGSDCVSAAATASSADYSLNNTARDCRLTYWLKKD